MNAPLEFELLKARRSAVFCWGLLGVALGVPAVTSLFVALVVHGGSSPAAAKAATWSPISALPGWWSWPVRWPSAGAGCRRTPTGPTAGPAPATWAAAPPAPLPDPRG